MIANAILNKHLEGEKLARDMDRPRWAGPIPIIRRIPRWAAFPWGMVDVIRETGLAGTWRLFSNSDSLVTSLAEGNVPMPILGTWKPLWAHVMPLVAHDPEKGWGFVNPAKKEGELDWIKPEVFAKQWRFLGNMVVEVRYG
jgi:hypothetical protein